MDSPPKKKGAQPHPSGWENELTFLNPGRKNRGITDTASDRERKKFKEIMRKIAVSEGRTPPPDTDDDEPAEAPQEVAPAIKTSSDATGKPLGKKRRRRKDVERKPGIDRRNRAGETQVMRAVHDADMDKVKVLIADGADVNIACNAGWTPLHESGIPEITTLLLEAEADPNARGPEGDGLTASTALHEACSHGNLEVIEVLLENFANPAITNSDGKIPADMLKEADSDTKSIRAILKKHVYKAPPTPSASSSEEDSEEEEEEEEEEPVKPAKVKPAKKRPAAKVKRTVKRVKRVTTPAKSAQAKKAAALAASNRAGTKKGGKQPKSAAYIEDSDEEVDPTPKPKAMPKPKAKAKAKAKAKPSKPTPKPTKKRPAKAPERPAPAKKAAPSKEVESDKSSNESSESSDDEPIQLPVKTKKAAPARATQKVPAVKAKGKAKAKAKSRATVSSSDESEAEAEESGGKAATEAKAAEAPTRTPVSKSTQKKLDMLADKGKKSEAKPGNPAPVEKKPREPSPPPVDPTKLGKPRISMQPEDQSIFSGQEVMFYISAHGKPDLRYQWSQGGVRLQDSPADTDKQAAERISGATRNMLRIYNVRSDEARKAAKTRFGTESITCTISNSEGQTESVAIKLTVKPSPAEKAKVLFQNHAEATDLATHLGLAPPVKLSLPKFRSIPSESEFKLVQQARNELNAWTKNNEKMLLSVLPGNAKAPAAPAPPSARPASQTSARPQEGWQQPQHQHPPRPQGAGAGMRPPPQMTQQQPRERSRWDSNSGPGQPPRRDSDGRPPPPPSDGSAHRSKSSGRVMI